MILKTRSPFGKENTSKGAGFFNEFSKNPSSHNYPNPPSPLNQHNAKPRHFKTPSGVTNIDTNPTCNWQTNELNLECDEILEELNHSGQK